MRVILPERRLFTVPPRNVVLLPDALFFCRTVPVDGASGTTGVAAQVELALEALSPFPVAQLHEGHYWRPGAKHACVFAAYRKRFTPQQVEEWADAEGVLPLFAALLASRVTRPTTLLLPAEDGFTAINWDDPNDVPVSVITRTLTPGSTDREALRAEVLRESGTGRALVELEAPPALEAASPGSDIFVFRSGATSAILTRDELDLIDVRDKEELAARRRARTRDLLLWRGFAGFAAGLLLCGILELSLIGGRIWQQARLAVADQLAPVVAKIVTADNLALQINDLATNRMRPFEMLSLLTEKKPASVMFDSVAASSLYTIEVEARTNSLNDAGSYRSALAALDACQNAEIKPGASRDGLSTFRLVVTFKPGAFDRAPQS